jgi:hypothetical protein
VARAHYGDAYPTKCVQTSIAVHRLLARLGIASPVWLGAFCAAEVFDSHVVGWGGFWGDEHHAWTTTEFYELIDLSVAEMTRHPRASRTDGIAIPPLWWDDITQWPQVLRYLPDSAVEPAFPDSSAMHDLDRFLHAVDQAFDDKLANGSVEGVRFGPMLRGADSMNDLTTRDILGWCGRSSFKTATPCSHLGSAIGSRSSSARAARDDARRRG